jgi:uncharacterized membrane-anchored protein
MALVVIVTVTAAATVAAAAASKIMEYYASHKNKDKSKRIWISHVFPHF